MNVLLDLDGTILDCRARIHALFCELAPDVLLDEEVYWEYKRLPRSNSWLLSNLGHWNDGRIKSFEAEWLERIEEQGLLAMDDLSQGTLQAVQSLSRRAELHLLTARRSTVNLDWQLKRLGLLPCFSSVLATGPGRSKVQTVLDARLKLDSSDMLVGDTAEDVETARALGLISVVICGGFRCEEYLRTHEPDYLYASLQSLASSHFAG